MTDLDDGTLYDRWLDTRDGDAFAELARRHSPVAFDLTCRVLGDRAGAEDVLQEALLSLALERTRKPVEVGVVAWLARFAICRARNRRASERCRTRRQIKVGLERPEGAMPDESLELTDELEHALAGADPEDRTLLAMRYLHGWDYDRIASALSIREGAARVRVHRALEAVRAKAGAKDARGVAPALAALPVAALTESQIDGAIRTAVEIAKVRLGAPPNGVEQATAASRSFRLAVTLTGAAMLFVGAAGATLVPHGTTGSDARASEADVASALADARVRASAADWRVTAPSPVDREFRGVPRPLDWDLGALRRVATGSGEDAPAAHAAAAAHDPVAPPPADAVVPPVAPPAAAPGAPLDLPAATPRHDGASADPTDDSPDALRPTSRAACAAKGEPASPEGERAGASGGSTEADEALPPAGGAPVADRVPRRRAGGSGTVQPGSLPDDTRALLGEAEALVRKYLEETGTAVAAADPAEVRDTVRAVRREFGKMRRDLGAAPRPRVVSGRAKRQRVALLRQVFSMLTEVVLADGRTAGALRWPSGADLEAALAEVIRVLGAQASGATVLPAGAAESPAADDASDVVTDVANDVVTEEAASRSLPSGLGATE